MKIAASRIWMMCAATLAVLAGGAAASAHEGRHGAQIELPAEAPTEGEPTPWTDLKALDAVAKYHFVVVTDRTGRARPGVWEDAMAKINLMQPVFTISVGDLIQGSTEDEATINSEWDEMNEMIGVLQAPFFYTPGNHDFSNPVMAEIWNERLGPSFYSFRFNGALFIVLNSNVMGDNPPEEWREVAEAQIAWLGRTLKDNEDVQWTYLFMHQPFWREYWWRSIEGEEWRGRRGHGREDWDEIAALLEGRDYTAFAGHTHSYDYEADAGGEHVHERISLATTGGGLTIEDTDSPEDDDDRPLLGPEYAEFDHFVWVTMTDDGPVIANLLLDGILPKDFDHFFKRPPANADEVPASD